MEDDMSFVNEMGYLASMAHTITFNENFSQ